MAGYLPSNDNQFVQWFEQFVSYLETHHARLGVAPADVAALAAALPDFSDARAAFDAARTAAKMARQTKDGQRQTSEELIRPVVARIQAGANTTNADREALGIPVRGAGANPQGVELGDYRPSAVIDIRPHLKHVLRIHNETDVGTFKRRPAGAMGCEIWRKVGDPPQGTSDMEFVGLATRSPYVVEYSEQDANKQAHYRFRWVSRNGAKGDWSEIDLATIAA